MTTSSASINLHGNNAQNAAPREHGIFCSIAAVVFAVNLRESLDADTAGDKSDAAFTWGM